MMLITESYRELNARLHKHSDKFGMGGAKWAMRAVSMCRHYGCKTILDYGCGKGALKKSLMAWDVQEYDPAIPGKNHAAPADLVVCTDVLEHIEPELLDSVLAHMVSMTDKRLLFCISTKLAKTHLLPDGRNPHLSHHDATWWKDKLGKYFRVADWNCRPSKPSRPWKRSNASSTCGSTPSVSARGCATIFLPMDGPQFWSVAAHR